MPDEMVIEGQAAGSVNEWNIYLGLLRMGHEDISYQYPLDGGRTVRGGQMIDFVDWETAPRATAIYVQGERWHTGRFAYEDNLKQDRAEKRGFAVVLIWEHECETPEQAYQTLRKKVF